MFAEQPEPLLRSLSRMPPTRNPRACTQLRPIPVTVRDCHKKGRTTMTRTSSQALPLRL